MKKIFIGILASIFMVSFAYADGSPVPPSPTMDNYLGYR